MSNNFNIKSNDCNFSNSYTVATPITGISTSSIMNTNKIYVSKSYVKTANLPGSAVYLKENKNVYEMCQAYIKEVIYSAPATIVFWSDSTKTVSKCDSTDTYNQETGLLLCVMKKICGGHNVANMLEAWIPAQISLSGATRQTLADVRKFYRE